MHTLAYRYIQYANMQVKTVRYRLSDSCRPEIGRVPAASGENNMPCYEMSTYKH